MGDTFAPVIEARGLAKRFANGRDALTDVSFAVDRGSIFGLIGRNGAGKTTTIRILLGLIRPTAGTVTIFGTSVETRDRVERSRVAAVVEHRGVDETQTVDNNLRLWGRIYRLSDHETTVRCDTLVPLLGLDLHRYDRAGKLSGGMKLKLAIGRALLVRPELLILDEPTAGLDPIFRREVLDLLRALRTQGTTVFLSSHDLADVQDICSRVALIDAGRAIACDDVAALVARVQGRRKRLRGANLNADAIRGVLQPRFRIARVTSDSGGTDVLFVDPIDVATVEHELASHGCGEWKIEDQPASLDDAFHILVQANRPVESPSWDRWLKTS